MNLHRKVAVAVATIVLTCTLVPTEANAFWGHHHRRPVVAYSPVVVPAYTAAQPFIVGRPIYARAPIVVGYAPAAPFVYPAAPATYAAPTTSYYAPSAIAPAAFAAPTTSYYAPSPAIAPTTYYAPAPVFAPAPVILVPWRNY